MQSVLSHLDPACPLTQCRPRSFCHTMQRGNNQGGCFLAQAERENDSTYDTVLDSGIASLQCLGSEVFGRWSKQCVDLVPALAWERTAGLHRRIRKGTALQLQRRWWGILGIALQKSVAHMVLCPDKHGMDLFTAHLESGACIADLPPL